MKKLLHWLWNRADVYLHICPCKVGRWTGSDRIELAGYELCCLLMKWGEDV